MTAEAILTLVKKLWLPALIAVLIGALAIAASHYKGNAESEARRADGAEERANSAKAISNNVIAVMNLINDISQATKNAKTQMAQKGEERIVYIRQALEGDQCAKQLVPAAAADSLREYADGLRTGASRLDKR
ncbi:DUF2570 domain-containing protein [Raoultella terrigena]|uniref:DUF2570 domain-containing protein n=1 Tax=Raoultella terrigena TaxID=577 RepID=UPI00349F5E34